MIVVPLLILGLLAQPVDDGAEAPDATVSDRPVDAQGPEAARAVVLEVLAGASTDGKGLHRAVARLGPEGLLALLRLIAAGGVTLETGPGRTRELRIGDAARSALLDAVGAQPRSAWLQAVDRLDPEWDGQGARVVVLELLARGATAADLGRFERTTRLEGQPASPELRYAARGALARILAASVDVPWRRLWGSIPGSLLAAFLDALEETGKADAVERLSDLLGSRPAADALVLERIERLLDPEAAGHRPFLVHEARRCLARSDASSRRFAVRVLGRLGDVGVLEDLAPLLTSVDGATADEARAAARRLVRDDLGPLPGPWLEWLHAERTWLAERGPELTEQIAGGDDAEAVAAMRELGRHRIDRAWRARTAALALEREPADLLVLACGALERFGTPAERALLEPLLTHPEERVRIAAARAARALAPQTVPES